MAIPFALLGLLGLSLSSVFFKDSDVFKKSIPETGPLPPQDPEHPVSQPFPSAYQSASELSDLFRRSYLVHRSSSRLQIHDPAAAERFQNKLIQVKEAAFQYPEAAQAYDIPAIRKYYFYEGLSKAGMGYGTYYIQDLAHLTEFEKEVAVTRGILRLVKVGEDIDLMQMYFRRLWGDEVAQPVFQRVSEKILAGDLSVGAEPKLLKSLEGLSQDEFESLVQWVHPALNMLFTANVVRTDPHLGEILKKIEMSPEIFSEKRKLIVSHMGIVAASRAKLFSDSLKNKVVESADQYRLPVDPSERELVRVKHCSDPLDDAVLFHSLISQLNHEVFALKKASIKERFDPERRGRMLALFDAVFFKLDLPETVRSEAVKSWREAVDALIVYKSTHVSSMKSQVDQGEVEISLDDELLREFMGWAGQVMVSDVQPPLRLDQFLRSHLSSVFIGPGNSSSEYGTVEPGSQAAFFNMDLVGAMGRGRFYLSLVHEAFHNYSDERMIQGTQAKKLPLLLSERNAYLFEYKLGRLLVRDFPALLNEKGLWKGFCYVKLRYLASNSLLGLSETDETLHFQVPPNANPQRLYQYPRDGVIAEYLQSQGYGSPMEFAAAEWARMFPNKEAWKPQ